jgi:hypothetical protein
MHDEPFIPWTFGEIIVRSLQPGPGTRTGAGSPQGSAPAVVPPGRWAVSPRTEVPFVQVASGIYGVAVRTWGEVFEVPAGTKATLSNASEHAGDVVLEGIGSGQGYGARTAPSTLSLPVAFTQLTGGAAWQTTEIDTRLARRAYLALDLPSGGAVVLPYTVQYRNGESGSGLPWVGAGGVWTWSPTAQRYVGMLSLGMGDGEQREAAPANNTLPTPRPHALGDSLRVFILNVDFVAAGLTDATPAVIVLEY